MNRSQQLSISVKKEFIELVSKYGWEDSIPEIIEKCDKNSIFIIRNEISKRYTNWFGLSQSGRKYAVVVESGLGANVVTLSKIHDMVYVVYLDDYSKSLVISRLKYLNITNVEHFSRHEVNLLPDFDSAPLIVSFNEENILLSKNIVEIIFNKTPESDLFYVCKNTDSNEMASRINDKLNILYYTGISKDPFQLIPSEYKLSDIGIVKYYIKKIFPGFFKEYVALTTLKFSNSLYEEVSKHIEMDLYGNSSQVNISRLFVSKPNGCILFLNISGDDMVVRMSFDGLSDRRLVSNASALEGISAFSDNIAPKLLTKGRFNGICYTVEQRLPGSNIENKNLSDEIKRRNIIDQTLLLVTRLHKLSLKYITLNNENYIKIIQDPIDKARSLFKEDLRETFDVISEYMRLMLYGKDVPMVLSHGDMSIDNIIVIDNKVTGIIDWDYSKLSGLPLVDVLYFISSTYKRRKGYSINDLVFNALSQSIFNEEEVSDVSTYCNSIGLDRSFIKPFGVMYAVHHMAFRLEQDEVYNFYKYYENLFSDLLCEIKLYIDNTK